MIQSSFRTLAAPLFTALALTLAGCAGETSNDDLDNDGVGADQTEEALTEATTLIPQKSIAGVSLDMNAAQVIEKLKNGQKPVATKAKNELVGAYERYRFGSPSVNTTVSLTEVQKIKGITYGGVFLVETTDPAIKTSKAFGSIHVGSKKSALLKVNGVRCTETDLCRIGRSTPGEVVTDFRIVGGRVTSVSVGYVID